MSLRLADKYGFGSRNGETLDDFLRRFKNFLEVRERLSQNFGYSDEDIGETTVRIFYIDSLDDVLQYSKRLKILKKFPLTYLYYRLL